MTFIQKDEKQIRQEVEKRFEEKGKDIDENKDVIEDIVQDRLKDEKFKASVHKSKEDKKKRIAELESKVEKKPDPKQGNQLKEAVKPGELNISTADMSWFFSKGGTRTELRYAQKVMKATGKNFNAALNDGLFQAWKKENDTKIKRPGAQLGSSRGGTRTPAKTDDDKMADKFSQNLPAGFSAKKPEKK